MSNSPQAQQAELNRFLAHQVLAMLPPPLEDTPTEHDLRSDVAAAIIGELQPMTMAEAEQAAIVAAANAHGRDCFRLAGKAGENTQLALKCRAQAASMFRQAGAARRELLRLQAKREAVAQRAAANPPQDTAPPHAAPHAAPHADPAAASAQPLAGPVAAPPAAALAEAEKFAREFPRRAIQIRRLGRIPAGTNGRLPSQAVVHALVHGRSPALCKLDRKVG